MACIKVDDVMIPIFDGVDYGNWKKRIMKFFELKNCKKPAMRNQTETDKAEDWVRADIKAINFIYRVSQLRLDSRFSPKVLSIKL